MAIITADASLDRAGTVEAGPSDADTPASTTTAQAWGKRCFDVGVALVLLLVILPLLAIIALVVALDSGWPVFYRQERVGARPRYRGGAVRWEESRFRILKFRTMRQDADDAVHERFVARFVTGACDDAGGEDGTFKLSGDPRVTRAGHVLRATSLDELPQLINVLAGTMSLVGPRPVPPYEVALYTARHRERLAARPGITGPWQVYGRGRVSFEEMVRLDVEYVRRPSLRRDLVLLARTLPAVLHKQGAR